MNVERSSADAPAGYTPHKISLVLISVVRWIDSRATVRPEELNQRKIPKGIEPAVPQSTAPAPVPLLNKLKITRPPHFGQKRSQKKIHISSRSYPPLAAPHLSHLSYRGTRFPVPCWYQSAPCVISYRVTTVIAIVLSLPSRSCFSSTDPSRCAVNTCWPALVCSILYHMPWSVEELHIGTALLEKWWNRRFGQFMRKKDVLMWREKMCSWGLRELWYSSAHKGHCVCYRRMSSEAEETADFC